MTGKKILRFVSVNPQIKCSIVSYLARKGLAAVTIDDDGISMLRADAISYISVLPPLGTG
jgi:hypothetical protein